MLGVREFEGRIVVEVVGVLVGVTVVVLEDETVGEGVLEGVGEGEEVKVLVVEVVEVEVLMLVVVAVEIAD